MKRLYVKTNGTNFVAFVDNENKAYIIDEAVFGESLTLEAAKAADYSNFDDCETAEECARAIGTPDAEANVIDWNEDEYSDCAIIEF